MASERATVPKAPMAAETARSRPSPATLARPAYALGRTVPPALQLVKPGTTRPPALAREETLEDLLASPGPGEPLPEAERGRIEASLRVDLSPIRVYSDARSRAIVDRLRARAFTFGRRIFLGSRELPTDLPLIAHEAAHVVQQRGRPVVQMSTGASSTGALELEADRAAMATRRGEPAQVVGRTAGAVVQRQERMGTIEEGPTQQQTAGEDEGWLQRMVWKTLGPYAEDVRAIATQGIGNWLLDKIRAGLQSLIDRLLAPVRPVIDAVSWVRQKFGAMVEVLRDAAGQLARNDCSLLTRAVERIQAVIEDVLTAIKEKLLAAWTRVKEFFASLWEHLGAPVWDLLKRIGGAIWEKIQQLGSWIWEKTKPVRDWLSRGWKWIKRKLGIGEGEESQNGVLQWIRKKAGQAWDWLSSKLAPLKKPFLVVAGIFLLFTPAGPFVAFGAAVVGVIKGIQWIRANMRSKSAPAEQRGFLQGTLIPMLMRGADAVIGALKAAAAAVAKKLGGAVAELGEAAGTVASSFLSFFARAIVWLQDKVQSFAQWANEHLSRVAEWIANALKRLKAFLQPVLDFLAEVAAVVGDIMKLPAVIVGKLWKMIPACIRDAFVNFFLKQILGRIPLLRDIIQTIATVWTKVRQAAINVLRKVFKEGDLKGALLEILKLVLSALNVPLELFVEIFKKGANALDLIMESPSRFLRNLLGALKTGLLGFGERIVSHLLNGLLDWIFGAAKQAGIRRPADLSLKSLLGFVLDVLDISVESVLGRLEKKIGAEKMKPIRTAVRVIGELWNWMSTLFNEGPEGVWNRLKEKLSDLWGLLIGEVSKWIAAQVAKKMAVRLAGLAAAPVGTIVTGLILIYDTIKAVVEYMRQILEIVSRVLDMVADIAKGNIAGAAALVESLLERALAVAIGFVAQLAGLGGLSKRIKEIVGVIRGKVNEAIDWLLEKAIKAGAAILGAVKSGVGKLIQWWKARAGFKRGKESHSLGFQGEGLGAVLIVESTPRVLEKYLQDEKIDGKARAEIKKHTDEIEEIKKRTKGGFGQADGEKIRRELELIAALLTKKPRPSAITFQTTKRGSFVDPVGSRMLAKPLTMVSGKDVAGSQPYQESDMWKAVNQRAGVYVRGHLLNHHVHGPGKNENLVPIPKDANTQMEQSYESTIKEKVLGEAETLEYEVRAKFGRRAPRRWVPAEEFIPTSLVFNAFVINDQDQHTKDLFKDRELQITLCEDKEPSGGPAVPDINLSSDTPGRIAEFPGIDLSLAERIVAARGELSGKTFSWYKELPVDEPLRAALQKSSHVTLRSHD